MGCWQGEYHVPAAFLDSFVMHMTKNYLTDKIGGEMPLCLGIWGKKGCGKSFMVELCCKAMGVEPIIMSAGELEDEWAGNPGKLIRERYRAAAMVIKNQGKMSCLVRHSLPRSTTALHCAVAAARSTDKANCNAQVINDLDAGAGRFTDTQVTVNNQMVSGTLMNLCDDPHQVRSYSAVACPPSGRGCSGNRIMRCGVQDTKSRQELHLVRYTSHLTLQKHRPGPDRGTVCERVTELSVTESTETEGAQVSVGQQWREEDLLPRVPIIVTANDLSTLYAPLLRDGRMEKYYWEPTYTDLHRMIHTCVRPSPISSLSMNWSVR